MKCERELANANNAEKSVKAYIAATRKTKNSGENLTDAERNVLESLSDDPNSKV